MGEVFLTIKTTARTVRSREMGISLILTDEECSPENVDAASTDHVFSEENRSQSSRDATPCLLEDDVKSPEDHTSSYDLFSSLKEFRWRYTQEKTALKPIQAC